MSITELGYVRFGVSNLEAWRTFAEEFIGLEVHPESEGDRLYLRLDDWHHRIILDKIRQTILSASVFEWLVRRSFAT